MSTSAFVVLIWMASSCELRAMASSGHFRGSSGTAASNPSTVTAEQVESSLKDSLEALLQGGTKRFAKIEASMWQTFQALPKNEMGRLAPRAVRYIVHNYFAKEHGWLIKGLEPHGHQANVTELHEVHILQDKAPALVEATLEDRRAGRGLSLEDAVAMAAALERLIFDESLGLLKTAYTMNGYNVSDEVGETTLHEVLTSYLLIFEMGLRGDHTDAARHQAMKDLVASQGSNWQTLVDFEQDAVRNYDYAKRHGANGFQQQRLYTFEDAAAIVEDLAQGYGKWQNSECKQMKQDLQNLDPDGSGRVPLSDFYSQHETADYQFSESVDYLKKIGALDESAAGGPRVRIANYVMGPSNCIASSSYYSVCCLSDCEHLLNDLEGHIKAPGASPKEILAAMDRVSSLADNPRKILDSLTEKLDAIAARNDGEVPLHGRLFAQWLHHAFPHECPFPHITEDSSVLTPGHWLDKKATAAAEERQLHVDARAGLAVAASEEEVLLEWSEDEVLPVREASSRRAAIFGDTIRIFMQIALVVVVARSAVAGVSKAAQAAGGCSNKGKSLLPHYA